MILMPARPHPRHAGMAHTTKGNAKLSCDVNTHLQSVKRLLEKKTALVPRLPTILSSAPATRWFNSTLPTCKLVNRDVKLHCGQCGQLMSQQMCVSVHPCPFKPKFTAEEMALLASLGALDGGVCRICGNKYSDGTDHECDSFLWRHLLLDFSGLPNASVSTLGDEEAASTAAGLITKLRAGCLGYIRFVFIVPPLARSGDSIELQMADEMTQGIAPLATSEALLLPSPMLLGARPPEEQHGVGSAISMRGIFFLHDLQHQVDITEEQCNAFSTGLQSGDEGHKVNPLVTRHFLCLYTGRRQVRPSSGWQQQDGDKDGNLMDMEASAGGQVVRYYPGRLGGLACLVNGGHDVSTNLVCSAVRYVKGHKLAGRQQPARASKQQSEEVAHDLVIKLLRARPGAPNHTGSGGVTAPEGWLLDSKAGLGFKAGRVGGEAMYDYERGDDGPCR